MVISSSFRAAETKLSLMSSCSPTPPFALDLPSRTQSWKGVASLLLSCRIPVTPNVLLKTQGKRIGAFNQIQKGIDSGPGLEQAPALEGLQGAPVINKASCPTTPPIGMVAGSLGEPETI